MKRYCLDCSVYYSPDLVENGKLPKGYKICPKCQSKKTKEWKRPIICSISPGPKGYPHSFSWGHDVRVHNEWCATLQAG